MKTWCLFLCFVHISFIYRSRLAFSVTSVYRIKRLELLLAVTAYPLSATSYLWPFLKALRFYLLHENGTSGQFEFELKLPWYWLGWVMQSVKRVFSSSIFFFFLHRQFFVQPFLSRWLSFFAIIMQLGNLEELSLIILNYILTLSGSTPYLISSIDV